MWKYVALAGSAQACNMNQSDMYSDFDFLRHSAQTLHNSFVKGIYHDSHHYPVDSKCWGDWMDAQHTQNVALFNKLFVQGDVWGVSHEELKQASDNIWESFFTNIDSCGEYKIVYDYYMWCSDNIG